MEKQDQNIRSWDDLIFENRNMAYGAYALRQEYSMGVTKGLLTGIGILISIFVVAGFINSNSSILPKTTDDGIICILPVAPTIVPVEVQKSTVQPVKTKINLPPVAVITPEPVEPTPEPATTSPGTEGTPDGTAPSDTGTSGSFSTGTDLGTVDVKSNEPFIHVEVMPVYKGGFEGMMKTLRKNMRYPRSAQQMGKEGTVYVEFIVNDEGEIRHVKVLRGFDRDCDKEAVRMVEKLTEWTPGLQNKIAVNVRLVLPIKFKLEPQ
jgi:periplasmic protein TonB